MLRNLFTYIGRKKRRKLVLVSANGEYISAPSTITLEDGKSFAFKFDLPDHSVQRFLGAMEDASSYVVLQADGSAFVQLSISGFSIPIGETVIGENYLTLRKSGTSFYGSVNGGTESSVVSAGVFEMEQIAKRLGSKRDVKLIDLLTNDEYFPCNEISGASLYGSKGTILTVETAHEDGNDHIKDTVRKLL